MPDFYDIPPPRPTVTAVQGPSGAADVAPATAMDSVITIAVAIAAVLVLVLFVRRRRGR
jgi:hypothetical protein